MLGNAVHRRVDHVVPFGERVVYEGVAYALLAESLCPFSTHCAHNLQDIHRCEQLKVTFASANSSTEGHRSELPLRHAAPRSSPQCAVRQSTPAHAFGCAPDSPTECCRPPPRPTLPKAQRGRVLHEARKHQPHQARQIVLGEPMTSEGTRPFEQFLELHVSSEMHAEAIGRERFAIAQRRGRRLRRTGEPSQGGDCLPPTRLPVQLRLAELDASCGNTRRTARSRSAS